MTQRLWMVLWLVGCAKQVPVLSPVNFESGTTQYVNDADAVAVEEAAEVLRTTNWNLIVLGLADAEGDPASNLVLSRDRAEVVAAKLRDLTDVDDSRIVVHGWGERLAVGESVRERKVEFVFYKDADEPIKQVIEESGVLDADFRRKEKALDEARHEKKE